MLRRTVLSACSVVLLVVATAGPSTAQPFDKRTVFTFSTPVSMPGIKLPAGQYLFRLANPDSGRNVVQVLSADGTKPYGMFFSIRAERFEPASAPEVRLMETAAGLPPAIRTWWYPGERAGYEFVYPKDQARRLAQRASEPVLTTETASDRNRTDEYRGPDTNFVGGRGEPRQRRRRTDAVDSGRHEPAGSRGPGRPFDRQRDHPRPSRRRPLARDHAAAKSACIAAADGQSAAHCVLRRVPRVVCRRGIRSMATGASVASVDVTRALRASHRRLMPCTLTIEGEDVGHERGEHTQ